MDQVKNLLTVRKLVTLIFVVVGCYLWAIGKVDLKDAFLMVISYYFGNKTALDVPGKDS